MTAAGIAIIIIVGSFLLYHRHTVKRAREQGIFDAGRSSSETSVTASDPFQKLVGRWRRPDGGYVLEIGSVEPGGEVHAAYFNPRSIHVSQAQARQKEGKIQVFIELRDTGYPGATYSLTLGAQGDVLAGTYFQPIAGQSFGVVFSRLPP